MKAGNCTQSFYDLNRGRVQGCMQTARAAKMIGHTMLCQHAVRLARVFHREVLYYRMLLRLRGDV